MPQSEGTLPPSVLRVPGHLMVFLQVFADRDERRDAIAHRRPELLGRAAPDISRGEDAGHRRGETALVVDKAAELKIDAPRKKGGVGTETDENERGPRRDH